MFSILHPARRAGGIDEAELKTEPSSVLTLRDLDAWPTTGVALAVLGHPIKHSISPAMHNAALAEMAQRDRRFADWTYHRFEVPPDDLPTALAKLHEKQFLGLNLTVPHKVLALAHVKHVDETAAHAGAVNTLRWRPDGWDSFNTDGDGLEAGVRDDLGVSLRGADVLLLGAGGAARGAAVQCLTKGCASLTIVNRTAANLEKLLHDLAPLAGNARLQGRLSSEGAAGLPPGLLVINATSAGLNPDDPLPIDLRPLTSPSGVYDMIYNPPQTALLREAALLGIPHANGLSMLVHQGARALAIWSETRPPVPAMQLAARNALRRS